MIPKKIWAWSRTKTGGWWALNRTSTPASSEALPYYNIPDELIDKINKLLETEVAPEAWAFGAHILLFRLAAIIDGKDAKQTK